MGHFPTKQTQNLHLAVSKNRQIWEKLSHYFPLPVYGIKICKCDKPGCFIRQYTIVSSMKMTMYVGHPISSDNGLISQKLLRKSEFYYSLHVAMGVA